MVSIDLVVNADLNCFELTSQAFDLSNLKCSKLLFEESIIHFYSLGLFCLFHNKSAGHKRTRFIGARFIPLPHAKKESCVIFVIPPRTIKRRAVLLH